MGSFREPNAWTVSLLLATGVVIIARHPIAHMLGTEVDPPAVTVQAPAGVVGSAALKPAAPTLAAVAVPTHAPVDPFRPLVSTTGKLLAPAPLATAPVAAAAAKAAVAATTPPVAAKPATSPTAVTTTAGACAGAVHVIVRGDTLWSLAARATRSTDTGRVTLAWHRLYAANRETLGPDPSLLQVGEQICVPTNL
jgi:nucleoid-associated protein YgaU